MKIKSTILAGAAAVLLAFGGGTGASAANQIGLYAEYFLDQPFFYFLDPAGTSFSDVAIQSVGGLWPGETLDFGPMSAGGVASFFGNPSGAFAGDYDDMYSQETTYQGVLVSNGHTYLTNIFSPSSNLTGGYVDFLGLGADADTAPFLVATASVPEPQEWSLLILGLGLLGCGLRRRRAVTYADRRAA